MANKRVSELNELLATGVEQVDLFLITDVSAFESKRIRASELQAYSLQGTASWAAHAVSSSYADQARSASWAPIQVSASYALSASYSNWARTASYVISASYALSSSWADTAFRAVTASYAMTASVNLTISSGRADRADTASYLLYTPGINNGTASYAIESEYSDASGTASFLSYSPLYSNGTASFATSASYAISASNVVSSSYLISDGVTFNGSASYAVSTSFSVRSRYVQKPTLAGIYVANTSTSASRVSMSFSRSDFSYSQTFVTFTGTVLYNYTGSLSGSLTMAVYNPVTTTTFVFDTFPISYSAGGPGSTISGTVSQPVTMQGVQNLLNGNYLIYVTASATPGLLFEGTRNMQFRIDTEADTVTSIPI